MMETSLMIRTRTRTLGSRGCIVSINHSLCHYSFRGSRVVPFSTSRYGWRPPSSRCCLRHAQNVSWDGTPIVKPKQIDIQMDVQSSSIGVSTNIDWANLSHEQFDEQLQNLRQRLPNFTMTMLSDDEREKFWLRRNAAALKVAQEVSDMIGNNDLITPLEELRRSRGGDPLVEFTNVHSADVKCSNSNIPDEKFSERDVEEAARHMLIEKGDAINGLPIFYLSSNSVLKLRRWSNVALDTNIWLRSGQLNFSGSKASEDAVKKLLGLPINFVVGAASYTEVASVVMRENTKLENLAVVLTWHERVKIQMRYWFVAVVRNFLIILVKRVPFSCIKSALGWFSLLHNENMAARKKAKQNVGNVNRQVRLAAIERLHKFMDYYSMAQYELGRAAHLEDLQLMKETPFALQAYDSQLVRQCCDTFCHLFLTFDKGLKHGRSVVCIKEGMRRRMLFWDISVETWEG